MEKAAVTDGRRSYGKRRRTLFSCTECHRRKQKCDRQRPCQNCVKRCKPDLCRFGKRDHEACNTTTAHLASADPVQSRQPLSKTYQISSEGHRHLTNMLGYSAHNAYSSFGLIKKAGTTDSSTNSPPSPANVFDRKQTTLDDKYRSLVRQLPVNEYIDILVQQFFSEVNWQYDVVDEVIFHRQLGSWRRHPYSAHNQASGSLPADILAFPSLVSQVIAHSLIHQTGGERASSSLESLKYTPGMTFVDLAHDFSEAGYSTLEAIKKKDLSMVAVQSGILRASFLKNTGDVVEAWHAVGTTIRNAQEIGLHASGAAQTPLTSVDSQWDHEMRRRIWFVLHNWDIHMAVVLGRPITTIMTGESVGTPDDLAQRESEKPPRKRTDQDPPTPSSVIRIGYDIAYRYFPRVRELENRGAKVEEYHIVQETHALIVNNMDRMPRWCQRDNLDVHFDELPGCHWLPAARQSLTSGIHFVLLSLHRPYIFNVCESRAEAFKAALVVLTAQRQLFHMSEPKQYLSFNMVYPLFDAMVILLAILVLFPNENLGVSSQLAIEISCGIDIIAKVGQHNAMARAANNVLLALLPRLQGYYRQGLQSLKLHDDESTTESLGAGAADLPALETISNTGPMTDNLGASNPVEPVSLFHHQAQPTVSTAPNFDVESILPPRPVSDLFYQDVYALVPEYHQGVEFPADFVHFDGNHSDESFWSFMNDFNYF